MVNDSQLRNAIGKALEDKGTRNFTQTVDLVINFKGIDFSKPENRLNLEIPLPKGRGRAVKVAVFADGLAASEAKKAGADLVISPDRIDELSKDKNGLKRLADGHMFLSEPKLMVQIGKGLGQVLGVRGKMPKPLPPKGIESIIDRMRRSITLRSKGRYMPVVHAPIGSESMSADDLFENARYVLETVKGKVGDAGIKNAYIKLTMGRPVKVN